MIAEAAALLADHDGRDAASSTGVDSRWSSTGVDSRWSSTGVDSRSDGVKAAGKNGRVLDAGAVLSRGIVGKVGEAAAVKVTQDRAVIYNVPAVINSVRICGNAMHRLHKAWLHVDK